MYGQGQLRDAQTTQFSTEAVGFGPANKPSRPELEVVIEMIGESLLSLDESIRKITGSIETLGGGWAVQPGVNGAPCAPAAGDALSAIREHRDTAQRLAQNAQDVANRLRVLV